jgi:hypothetical protein
MKRSLHLSAAQMAMLSALGGLIMAIGFLLPGLMYTRFHHSSLSFRMLLILPPFLIGTTLLWLAGNRLKRGIKDRRWPSSDIEALQINLESGLWRAAYIACIAVWSLSIFKGGRMHDLAMAAYPLFLTISSLQTNLRRPNSSEPRLELDSLSLPTLRSEHWGER